MTSYPVEHLQLPDLVRSTSLRSKAPRLLSQPESQPAEPIRTVAFNGGRLILCECSNRVTLIL